MKTNFTVNGVKSKNTNSKISHIQRDAALKKNLFSPDSENINNLPHIIIFKKAIKSKNKNNVDTQARSKLSKQLEVYKSRVKKAEEELLKITDEKKRLLKIKTIDRNKKKYKELLEKRDNTKKSRNAKQYDFVDIPFSITGCKPELLSKEDYKKLSDIAIEVTLFTFDIDKNKIGSTAHLDQASTHVHISFEVPEGLTLSEIKKVETYRKSQLLFNKKIKEAFPHLKIDKICDKAHDSNPYTDLKTFKHKCEMAKMEKELNNTKENLSYIENESLKVEYLENELSEARETIKEQKTSISTLKEEKEQIKQDMDDLKGKNIELKKENADLEFEVLDFSLAKDEIKELKEENSKLKDFINKIGNIMSTTKDEIIDKIKSFISKPVKEDIDIKKAMENIDNYHSEKSTNIGYK